MRLIIFLFVMLSSITCFAADQNPVYTETKQAITVTAGQPSFTIQLKSNPTTGYSWFLRDYNDKLLTPVKHSYVAPANNHLVGASGYEVWMFRANPKAFTVPQQTMIKFVYARPWQSTDPSTELVFKVTLH